MLVERGADPCFKNRKGKTPCDVAAAAVHNFLMTAKGEWHLNIVFNSYRMPYRKLYFGLKTNPKKTIHIIIVI